MSNHTSRADAGTAARLAQGAAATQEPRGFATTAIHGGYRPDTHTGAINVPIYASTTFAQDDVATLRGGYEYSRVGNPTVTALENVVAALEGGAYGRAFASGMAATDTVIRALLRPGDHLILGNDAYGGTFRLIDTSLKDWGVQHTVVDMTDPEQVRAALRDNTRLVWVESPTNPLLSITDIAAVAQAIDAHPARLVVDNTFASPYLQRPLELGADAVLHSTTKYIGGHSDVVGGVVVTNDADLDSELLFLQGGVGAVPSAFDAYLAYRGVKTLPLRMEKHCANALAVARLLKESPKVSQVLFPGLPDHPGYEVAQRQMRGPGGMISVRFAGGREAALAFCRATRLICLAESLGGVESLLEHPATMTHQSAAGSQLEVPDDLVRISIGIEDEADLLADVERALGEV
ncbi:MULTISPECIES: cystathionine gamma-synthase [unclassified Corynebacterium]|uniref:cystathionine gamma-synthase n=1 Tax=unclassified Corynebacterium TaxID=2624378 RepID=UPI0029CA9D52|nr:MULTISPECIES: cystathionine gamma-synthase [unclassified Corynebacterium]WPF65649.1 cystathionine gamma-synthase [Corynebacterium sp. 22KM0430]WPF68145.1 cystathionine gamma-synthase [Corynebacterium sp. 21KM1197]